MEKVKVMDFVLELREAKASCEKSEMAILNLKKAESVTGELIPMLVEKYSDDGAWLPNDIEDKFKELRTTIKEAQVRAYDNAVHAQDDYIAVLEDMLTESMGVTFDFDEDGRARVTLSE